MDAALAPGRAGGRRRPAWSGRVLVVAAMAAVATIPLARFLTAGSGGGSETVTAPPPAERVASLRQRVATDPDDAAAWLALAELTTRDATRTGDPAAYDLARRAVTEAKRLLPDDGRAVTVDGVLALSLHDFTRAYDLGLAAVAASPASGAARGVLVDAATELGRYDEATGHVQAMLDLRPDAAALARASYQRELRGDLPGAVTAMRQAVAASRADPVDAGLMNELLGDLHLAAGDLRSAAQAYAAASEAVPERPGPALGLARVRYAEGDLDGAIALADDVAGRTSLPAATTLLGELRLAGGDRASAAEAFALVEANDRLLAAAGVTTDLEAALFAADHGDPSEAVRHGEAAYGARRTVFTADALGWALTRAGQPSLALPFVEEALRLGTASAALHVHAAVTYDAVGRGADARAELERAFVLSPWPALHLRTTALELAELLMVPVPGEWGL
jgi:tetratricopeptide (TPR) repeat protein